MREQRTFFENEEQKKSDTKETRKETTINKSPEDKWEETTRKKP
jgi:hypothetical protein